MFDELAEKRQVLYDNFNMELLAIEYQERAAVEEARRVAREEFNAAQDALYEALAALTEKEA